MAELRRIEHGPVVLLESELVVGRSPECKLRVSRDYVSAHHAAIRWNGDGWEVRDLASTNGTFLEGSRIPPGSVLAIRRGEVVCFGNLAERWQLVDDSPPQVTLAAEQQTPLVIDGELFALPSPENPKATLFRGRDGRWRLERPGVSDVVLSSGDAFDVEGVRYRFTCPNVLAPTSTVNETEDLRDLGLRFSVSRDEEYVEITVESSSRTIRLRPRNHDYILLLLARQRLADQAARNPEGECGWVYQDELERALQVCTNQMHIDIYRIRKEFESLGIKNAAQIVERRPRLKQIRIGTGRLVITNP